MWLKLSEKKQETSEFWGLQVKNVCIRWENQGFLGRCWVILSQTSSWNRHYTLWITNNTKMGQGKNRGKKRGNAHKPHNGYSYRENEEFHSDSSSNSDEEDGNENENDLVSSSNASFSQTIIQPS